MSKQRAEKTKYRVYYGVDSNAALQPEYIPQQPRRKERTAPKKAPMPKKKHNGRRKLPNIPHWWFWYSVLLPWAFDRFAKC